MSEESKIWVSFFTLGILVSLCFAAQYLSSVDTANLALRETRDKLTYTQDQLSYKKKTWNEKEQVALKLQAESDKNTVLVKAQGVVDQRYHKADYALTDALQSMQASVERTRNNASGTELGELTLANGKALHAVKIRKVDDASISVIHADGSGTIPLELIPESLKEQYDLGPNALVPMIQGAQTAFLQEPAENAANNPPISMPEPPAISSSVGPVAKLTVDEAKAKSIRLKIAELDSRLSTYEGYAASYRSAARSHQKLAQTAKARGVPSTGHTANANKNLAQAASIESQMAAIREERAKLVIELEYAIRGK
ncbi:MAG: hypothetical protein J0L73_03575 [Verrucomicrobia bacterium]|nr:hypothetical protein [Verrucomicrobiota bacterium]